MSLVFCITCKGRTQHLEQTLPKNLHDNPIAKFVLLDYNDGSDLMAYIQKRHHQDIESGRLAVYSFHEPGACFRMAHAKNMAHRLGIMEGGDILVNLDADNFTSCGFDQYVLDHFASKKDSFLWARMIKGPNGLTRGISGRIAVTSTAFLNTGGYDEQFNKWGPDDKDFHARLKRLGYKAFEIENRFLSSVRHSNRMRFKEYPDACDRVEDFEGVHESEATVVNDGNIGTGIVFRNFCFEHPQHIGPIPTRIFGIGLQKTATTSLHHALSILGYDSAHWKSAHWAKAIWEEMATWGRSNTLERSYALCDLPIPMLFKELDLAYPGSKFILTLRDEAGWLDSVQKHWDPKFNKFRETWNHDPFSHRVHRLLYGQKGFNAEVFLARYRRHNCEVLDYFKDRPEDLLVMDMDKGAGWRELCKFLQRHIPARDYPRAYDSY